jgi:hypothetical protein
MRVDSRTYPPVLHSYAQVFHHYSQLLHTLTHIDSGFSNTSHPNLIKLRTLATICQWSLGGFVYEHRRTPQPRKQLQ